MKILHLSDGGLPDGRVERSARTSARMGHTVYFCGKIDTKSGSHGIFKELFNLGWTPKARLKIPFYWMRLKKQLAMILNNIKPDIIHAHNVCAAKLASETQYPFVFDDHEHVSLELKALSEVDHLPRRKKYLSNFLARRLWTDWERQISVAVPTITVGENIANDYRSFGGKVFVVPNMPSKNEFNHGKQLEFTSTNLSSIYAGIENTDFTVPYRKMTGLTDLFRSNDIGALFFIGMKNNSTMTHPAINYRGVLPRTEMYNEFERHCIGLLPWKTHWFHKYCNPNKAYEYAHCGLLVMLTDDFAEVKSYLKGNCVPFTDYEDLRDKLAHYKDHLSEVDKLREDAYDFAKKNLFWEKYEDNIIQAYQLA